MCGPACLKIVSTYFGVTVSERRIVRLCRSRLTSGTTGANLAKAARSLGLSAQIVDDARFKTIEQWLRRGVPVIVDWMSARHNRRSGHPVAVGHYSVVCGLTGKDIILEDPAVGRRKRIDRRTFLRLWFDFHYLYPTHKDDLILRRLIVVAPKNLTSSKRRRSAS
jgi:ABC-type bacteriocin/lantibiotic exporter with double-glycine peptidase domain